MLTLNRGHAASREEAKLGDKTAIPVRNATGACPGGCRGRAGVPASR